MFVEQKTKQNETKTSIEITWWFVSVWHKIEILPNKGIVINFLMFTKCFAVQ